MLLLVPLKSYVRHNYSVNTSWWSVKSFLKARDPYLRQLDAIEALGYFNRDPFDGAGPVDLSVLSCPVSGATGRSHRLERAFSSCS